jgi:aspartate beta-hydroxylase
MNGQQPPPGDPSQQAQLLLRAGRVEEAERAFLRVLDSNPFDLQALNIVGLASIRMGQLHRAREVLERAVSTRPDHAASQHHLGRALELLGDLRGAADHYSRATRLDANLPAARLHLAAVLDRLGDADAALVQYCRVMSDVQTQGKWVDRTTTPPALVPLVEQAVQRVRNGRRAMLDALLTPLAAEFGSDELQRVQWMLRIYLGEEPAIYSDPRQRPTFLFFPGLPTAPYLDRSLFEWLPEFEAQTPAILDELMSLLPQGTGSERVFSSAALEDENLRGTRGPPSWTGHYFYRSGERRDDNCAACPRTSAALDKLPLSRVAGHGPEVLHSVFTPGTHLLAHKGVTNTRVVGHLPLIVPPDCALRVGGEDHVWQEGRVVVFDDTYEHEAWNRSDHTRVVMIFDMWNPHLTPVERLATVRLVETIGEFRATMTQA